ncbi:hypothetical protein Lal_00004347 [Lupinus albus]|nr:hypothetical protein Lal_00004347 [Lupinus albus]
MQQGLAGEASCGGRTVVVGMKLDSPSKELLTWVLVKVAQPGDTVVALHVLVNHEIMNLDGKSSLISLVTAFNPVLAVCEGFCNLKQVDLKLKICKGSSVKEILVREANAYAATHVMVGISQAHHKIWSSKSVAKYCARKLSKNCCVFAVNNGKVVFKRIRDASPLNDGASDLQGIDCHYRNGLLGLTEWPLSKSSEVLSDDTASMGVDKGSGKISDHSFAKVLLDSTENVRRQSCSVCGSTLALLNTSSHQSAEESSGQGGSENSLAIVPVKTTDASQLELVPGWPLSHREILSDRQPLDLSSLHQISVVPWAMRLPCKRLSYYAYHDHRSKSCDRGHDHSVALDSKSGALVPVDAEIVTAYSPERNSISIPRELGSLHDKYSATCRLFEYRELVSATSNFLPGVFLSTGLAKFNLTQLVYSF